MEEEEASQHSVGGLSAASAGDEEDFLNDEDVEDDEATMDEEEAIGNEQEEDGDELGDLEADNDISIDELRRMYGYGAGVLEEEADEEEEEGEGDGEEEAGEREENGEIEENGEAEGGETEFTMQEAAVSSSTTVHAADSGRGYFDDDDDGEADTDYAPPDRKEPRIDPEKYQALIPCFESEASPPAVEEEDDQRGKLLWSPSLLCEKNLSPDDVTDFLAQWITRKYTVSTGAATTTATANHLAEDVVERTRMDCLTRDDERALFALLISGMVPEEALALAKTTAETMAAETDSVVPLNILPNEPLITKPYPTKPWSDVDVSLFEDGVIRFNKNFHNIRNILLPERTIGELVDFYYTWKKSSRFERYLERRRTRVANPNTTTYLHAYGDFMEDVIHQMEQSAKPYTGNQVDENVAAARGALGAPNTLGLPTHLGMPSHLGMPTHGGGGLLDHSTDAAESNDGPAAAAEMRPDWWQAPAVPAAAAPAPTVAVSADDKTAKA